MKKIELTEDEIALVLNAVENKRQDTDVSLTLGLYSNEVKEILINRTNVCESILKKLGVKS